MVAVAVAALVMATAISGYRLKQRRDHSLASARYHNLRELWLRQHEAHLRQVVQAAYHSIRMAADHPGKGEVQPDLTYQNAAARLLEEKALLASRRVEYHAAMARKHQRIARYPWLLVEPDPPEPE
jgi:hypothetical protein